jgi:hypothetical protein
VVIYAEKLVGGTEQTVRFCIELTRPYQLIDASTTPAEDAGKSIADSVRKHNVEVLNVAGPRQSEWADGYDYTFRALESFLRLCSHRPVGG